jgi:hypothetical protein
MVDQISSLLHMLQNPSFRVQKHIFYVVRVPKHQEEVVHLLGYLLRRFEAAAKLDKLISLASSSVVDAETNALFGHDVFSHVEPHNPSANPTNLAAVHNIQYFSMNSCISEAVVINLTFSWSSSI